jgi:hypothetical protein
MKLLIAFFSVIVALPVLLIVAIALGPVILGVLCAAACGFIVFTLGNMALGLGWLGRGAQRSAARHAHSR